MANKLYLSVLATLAACAAPPRQPAAPDLDRAGPPVEPRSLAVALESTGAKILAAAVAPWTAERVVGSVKVLHGRTACAVADWLGVLPMVWPPNVEPVVGVEWRCEWTTLAMGAPREWPVMFLMSIEDSERPADVDVSGWNPLGPGPMTGCHVQVGVSGFGLVTPSSSNDGAWLYRDPSDAGRIRMKWTPTADYIGKTVFLQMAVFVPFDVAASGMLLSPGLAITVGRR